MPAPIEKDSASTKGPASAREFSCPFFALSPSNFSEAGTYEDLLLRVEILEYGVGQAEERLEVAREAARRFRRELARRLSQLVTSCGPPPPLNE